MRIGLQGVELDYLAIDKQDFIVFKYCRHFHPYIIKSHTKVIISHPSVRSLLVQKETRDRRRNWLISLQEYDLEIKLAKIVKG